MIESMPPREAGGPNKNPQRALDDRFRAPLMSYFLRRLRDRSEAEDCTQEVLMRAVSAPGLDRIDHADAYIFKIAVNLLRDRKRQEVRRGIIGVIPIDEAITYEPGSPLAEDLSPERVLLSRDSLADVLRALDELGEKTRDIFILFRLESMKQKDIAVLYSISQSSVEKHVVKAVSHLVASFGRKSRTHE